MLEMREQSATGAHLGQLESLSNESRKEQRFGFVALVGCPNAGKSTLLNACIGQKIAGVSAKPQTTRNRIIGLIQGDRTQIALLDTPGFLKADEVPRGSRLVRYMNREAWGSLSGADVICYLVDASRGPTDRDIQIITELTQSAPSKLRIVLTKSDKVPKAYHGIILQQMHDALISVASQAPSDQSSSEAKPKVHSIPVDLMSAKVPDEVNGFIERLSRLMPIGPHHFGSDVVTDRNPAFVSSELIREQIFRCLGQELPYGVGVKIDKFERRPDKMLFLSATIVVSKEAHKAMVIGRAGSKLKEIGSKARTSLERYWGSRIFLQTFVKVQSNWDCSDAGVTEVQGSPSDAGSAGLASKSGVLV